MKLKPLKLENGKEVLINPDAVSAISVESSGVKIHMACRTQLHFPDPLEKVLKLIYGTENINNLKKEQNNAHSNT